MSFLFSALWIFMVLARPCPSFLLPLILSYIINILFIILLIIYPLEIFVPKGERVFDPFPRSLLGPSYLTHSLFDVFSAL